MNQVGVSGASVWSEINSLEINTSLVNNAFAANAI